MDRQTLLQTLAFIDEFINSVKMGDNYWIDPKGETHTTDISYGLEFWEQIKTYLQGSI